MKFYGKLAAAIAILAFILWWLQNQAEEQKTIVPPSTPAPVVQATPAPPPVPTPPPTPNVAQQDPGVGRAGEIAKAAGLTLVGAREDNGWIVVTVRGPGRNEVNGFLDEAIKAGMKDVDVNHNQYHQIPQRNGSIVHEGVYRIRF